MLNEFIYLNKVPVNFDSNNLPKSQDINGLEKLTFGCSIIPCHLLKKHKFIFGDIPYFYNMSNRIKNIDIDEEFDFDIAELIYKYLIR